MAISRAAALALAASGDILGVFLAAPEDKNDALALLFVAPA